MVQEETEIFFFFFHKVCLPMWSNWAHIHNRIKNVYFMFRFWWIVDMVSFLAERCLFNVCLFWKSWLFKGDSLCLRYTNSKTFRLIVDKHYKSWSLFWEKYFIYCWKVTMSIICIVKRKFKPRNRKEDSVDCHGTMIWDLARHDT